MLIPLSAEGAGIHAKVLRRAILVRAMRAGWTILLLQTLAEVAKVATRKSGNPIEDIRRTIAAWRAVLPIQAAAADDLAAALEAFRAHRLPFWDAMLWASAERADVVRNGMVRGGPEATSRIMDLAA
jgi:predicted nucleic acid-binding protein